MNDKKNILICSALASEIKPLKKKFNNDANVSIIKNGTAEIFKFENGRILIFEIIGAGKVNSAINCFNAVNKFKPDLICHIGCCGSLTETIKSGAIILPQAVEECDTLCRINSKNIHLKLNNHKLVCNKNLGVPENFIVDNRGMLSADTLLLDKISRDELAVKFKEFIGYDMESYSVAAVAAAAEIPVIIAKTVVDFCAADIQKTDKFNIDHNRIYTLNEIAFELYNKIVNNSDFKKNIANLAEFIFKLK